MVGNVGIPAAWTHAALLDLWVVAGVEGLAAQEFEADLPDAFEARTGTLANRAPRAPHKPRPRTGLTVFTPPVRPFAPTP